MKDIDQDVYIPVPKYQCKKCGQAVEFTVKYHVNCQCFGNDDNPDWKTYDEHLHIKCFICGYSWMEKTFDQKETK